MKRFAFCVAWVIPVLFGTMAFAQESAELISVLDMSQSTILSGTINISEERPEAAQGMVHVQIGVGPGGPPSGTFTGELEVLAEKGSISCASMSELPQILIYQRGDDQIIRQTYAKKNIDAFAVANQLKRSLTFSDLINEVKRAKRVRTSDIGDNKEYRVTIDGDYFEQPAEALADGMPPMPVMPFGESVLEGILTIQVSATKEIEQLRFEIQYNDPMAMILQNAVKGGGGVQLELADMKKSTVPGRKMIVEFKKNASGSPKAKAFAEEAVRLLSK